MIKKVNLLTEDVTRSRDWVRELGSDGTDEDKGRVSVTKTVRWGAEWIKLLTGWSTTQYSVKVLTAYVVPVFLKC